MDDIKTLKNSEIQTELWAFSFTIKSPTKKSETNHSKKLLFSFLKYFPLEKQENTSFTFVGLLLSIKKSHE